MKKLFALLLAVCLAAVCIPAAAAEKPVIEGPIRVRINSDIAGCTSAHYTQIVELLSDNVTYEFFGSGPVSISDYAGRGEYAHVAAGRTYEITCQLAAAEGCALPDVLTDGMVQIECGKGVKVLSTQIVSADIRGEDGQPVSFRALQIRAQVVVDGTVFQRIIGWFTDIVLKIKSWQLY